VIRLSLLALAFASGPAVATESLKAVPARFRGEWNADLAHCGTGLNDSRLQIGSGRIRFYESGGPIRAVVTQGEFDLAVISELSGEGQVWLSYRHFRLSADHAYLTDVTGDDSGMVRYRCPKAQK